MMKLSIALVILVSLSFTNRPAAEQREPLVIRHTIALTIPVKYETNEELSRLLFSANDKMVYAAVLTTASGRYPFAVSIYSNKEKTGIAKAFEETVQFKSPDATGYRLLDWGVYKKNNKTLRYKVSETGLDSAATNSILYYFMKADASTELYEIKISCEPKSREEMKGLLEKIALSLTFL